MWPDGRTDRATVRRTDRQTLTVGIIVIDGQSWINQ